MLKHIATIEFDESVTAPEFTGLGRGKLERCFRDIFPDRNLTFSSCSYPKDHCPRNSIKVFEIVQSKNCYCDDVIG